MRCSLITKILIQPTFQDIILLVKYGDIFILTNFGLDFYSWFSKEKIGHSSLLIAKKLQLYT